MWQAIDIKGEQYDRAELINRPSYLNYSHISSLAIVHDLLCYSYFSKYWTSFISYPSLFIRLHEVEKSVRFYRQLAMTELTLSAHAREGYSSRPVCLSVTLWFWRLLTINRWFRYELTQNEDLGPFIVLLIWIRAICWENTKLSAQHKCQLLWVMPLTFTS